MTGIPLQDETVAWAKPEHPKAAIDSAGQFLVAAQRNFALGQWVNAVEYEDSLQILNNWRSSHSFPLNTFQATLRKKARKIYENALVAQRIKRVPSILDKLERYSTMHLSQMQDLGGCRAVLDTSAHATRLKHSYFMSDVKHELLRHKDYIAEPKDSGYRGIHLIYRYRSDKKETYNGLQIEMQLRSRIQHAWATAVETVGTFLRQSLKSSEGSEQWLRFFAVVSSAFAHLEREPPVPDTPTDKRVLRRFIAREGKALQVESKLRAYGAALDIVTDAVHENSHYFLLELNPSEQSLRVRGFSFGQLTLATDTYLEAEKQIAKSPGAQAVLVSANSLEGLRRAYPNFYLDTETFMHYLNIVSR